MEQYNTLKKELAKGWNTWNTRSVLSHVLLPEGFAINLGIKEYKGGDYLSEALVGRKQDKELSWHKDYSVEKVCPGAHAYDGSYTELNVSWRGIELNIETATVGDDIVILVTPIMNQKKKAVLIIESGILWNKDGYIRKTEDSINGIFRDREVNLFVTNEIADEKNVNVKTPYFAVVLDGEVGISTGTRKNIITIKKDIEKQRENHLTRMSRYGELSEAYNAMQTCMAWDTIYEPSKDRVVTPVTRVWNIDWGGYVLYCWDTYFAAYMASLDNKLLAYANAIEITREITKEGFVPNCSAAGGFKTLDRSQPLVGSMIIRELYNRYKDKWLLQMLFDDLYTWNSWYMENREVETGLMAWGSTPYEPVFDNVFETEIGGVGKLYGAAMESGLDNSPMYDDIPMNTKTNCMELADVGLTSLFIMDCTALYDIAVTIGRTYEAEELLKRKEKFQNGLLTLWDKENGIFANKRTDNGMFDDRYSPTNFYCFMIDNLTSEQIEDILSKHFYNDEEFWGDWVIPSIKKNHPAYKEQDYWRGRIWAPMNFLVYMGLRQSNLKNVCRDLVNKSKNLILKEWLECRHVHENYNAISGEGCDSHISDPFYHWGGLLAMIALVDAELN